jgi:hypothetical protein
MLCKRSSFPVQFCCSYCQNCSQRRCLGTIARSANSSMLAVVRRGVIWGSSVGIFPILVRHHMNFTPLLPQLQLCIFVSWCIDIPWATSIHVCRRFLRRRRCSNSRSKACISVQSTRITQCLFQCCSSSWRVKGMSHYSSCVTTGPWCALYIEHT